MGGADMRTGSVNLGPARARCPSKLAGAGPALSARRDHDGQPAPGVGSHGGDSKSDFSELPRMRAAVWRMTTDFRYAGS